MSFSKYQQSFGFVSAILLVSILLLGLFFRFANLEHKVFWVDEVSTAVRVSGYTVPEVENDLLKQNIVDATTLLSYQKLSPQRDFTASWQAITKSPEHAPLYFLLTRFWVKLWGDSIFAIRSLSVLISLLVFPSLYWLVEELFARHLISWLSVMLIGISPFYVAYAQEARPYSLWTVSILLMSASLLKAIRINCQSAWLIYSLSLIISFYTSLFSIYVAFFQGIYLLLNSAKKSLHTVKNYILYSGLAGLCFTPWILIMISNMNLLQENTSWMRGNFNLADIIAVFIGTNLLIFGDLPISQASDPIQTAIALITITVSTLAALKIASRWQSMPVKFGLLLTIYGSIFLFSNYIYVDWVTLIGALVALCILSLSVYALYYLITNTKSDRWLFVITLSLSLPISLLITDIINQGQSSTAPRYLIPLQLGILIAVAYTLGNKISANKITTVSQQKTWQLILLFFLSLGIFSCARNLNLSPFYQKGRNINNIAIAQIINQNDSALVIVEADEAMDLLSLAYSLNPEVKYKAIATEDNLLQYAAGFETIYVLKPSQKLKQKLENSTSMNAKQVYKSHIFSADEFPLDLWQVEAIAINEK